MTLRTLLTLTFIFVFAATAFAEKSGQRRTIIIKDGKVLTDSAEELDLTLLKPEGRFPDGDHLLGVKSLLGGKRAVLGVSLIDVTPELREYYGAGKDAGVVVGSLEDNGPAGKAGLHVGDIITAIDGKDVASSSQLRKAIKDKKEGDAVRLDILRGRNRQTLVVTLVEREMPGLPLLRLNELGPLGPSGEWRTRMSAMPNCVELQSRLKELEKKMKELEKKLQK